MSGRVVRIFLSSTFRDFSEERDLLVRKVFPTLRAKLQSRFVDLVDVDLRWGITEEEAERGEVLPICLSEIDRAVFRARAHNSFVAKIKLNDQSIESNARIHQQVR